MSSEAARGARKSLLAAGCAAAALALALAGGCSRGHGDPEGVLQLSSSEAGCLKGAGVKLDAYLKGQAGSQEIAGVWDCASRSLQLFADETRGAQPGVYSAQELRSFLEKYFLGDIKLSDSLLAETMELKRTVLGGTADQLTKDEIGRTRQLLTILREQTLKLQPYMPLTPEHLAELSEDQVREASEALVNAAEALSKPLQATGYPYPFERLGKLLKEFESAAPQEINLGLAEQLRSRLPAVEALKALLVQPEGDRIAGDEWGLVLTTGARWYSLALRFYALKQRYPSWSFGPGREAFVQLAHDAMALVRESLARRPRRTIPFEELDKVVAAVFPDGIAAGAPDKKVTVAHAQAFLRPVFQKLLGGASQYPRARIPGLTHVAVDRLEGLLEHWAAGQRYIESLYSDLASGQAGSGYPDYRAFSAADLLALDTASLPWSGDSIFGSAVGALQGVVRHEKPWFDGDDKELSFAPVAAVPRYTEHDLSEMNWTHEVARVLVRGYAEDPARALSGSDDGLKVSAPEFQRFVDDIRDISVDIKFLDASDHTQASKRFREANLFTFSANGDEFVSAREAAELLTLMVSAQRLTDRTHAKVADACRQADSELGMDDFDYPKIDADCYRKQFFGNVDSFWREMPGMIGFFRSLDDGERKDFEHAYEVASRKALYSPDPVNSSDTQGFSAVAQYVEAVFQRYDRDGDGLLDWDEADAAFPVFKSSLHEISCLQGHCLDGDGDLRTVFTYLLKYGQPPSTAEFLWWRVAHGLYSLDASRGKIVLIFAKLGSSTPSPGSAAGH